MVQIKAPRIPALSRTTRLEIPRRAGLAESVTHVSGFGPRKQKRISSSPGTNPMHMAGELGGFKPKLKRQAGGLTQHTAPYKHQVGGGGLTGDGNTEGVSGWEGPGAGEPV
jgi:hypothetical protein